MQALLDRPCEPERSAPALDPRRAFEDVRRTDMERGLVAFREQKPRVDADERFEIGPCHTAPTDRIVRSPVVPLCDSVPL